jgi:hypothetical protein
MNFMHDIYASYIVPVYLQLEHRLQNLLHSMVARSVWEQNPTRLSSTAHSVDTSTHESGGTEYEEQETSCETRNNRPFVDKVDQGRHFHPGVGGPGHKMQETSDHL